MRRFVLFAAASALLLSGPLSGPLFGQDKFTLQYFYDKNNETLTLLDMEWLTDKRALAVGALVSEQRSRGVIVSTSDAGATWTIEPFREIPRSLSFLDGSRGWIVTNRGLWQTLEGGRDWRKVTGRREFLRVRFRSANDGFAIGVGKTFERTSDGGRTWKPVPEGAQPDTRPETTAYSSIVLEGDRVLVSGFSLRPQVTDFPAWMDPEEAKKKYQRPSVSLFLQSIDGGATWKASASSLFGQISRLAMRGRYLLALLQFESQFEYPAEVQSLAAGASGVVFRDKTQEIQDVVITADGTVYLSGIEVRSAVRGIPLPGPVVVWRAQVADLKKWERLAVDYRASATRARLALTPAGLPVVFTDSGMILQLKAASPAQ